METKKGRLQYDEFDFGKAIGVSLTLENVNAKKYFSEI